MPYWLEVLRNLFFPVKKPQVLIEAPALPVAPITLPIMTTPTLMWDTPQNIFHAVRVLCDNAGLSLAEKNVICACIYQESQFHNYLPSGLPVEGKNTRLDGTVASTDWGLCQINDHYHIGPGRDFPSVDYVMHNPDKVVAWMIGMYKHGMLKQWVSYSSGAYKQWLVANSPMWLLRTV